jgi:hypothetical protein
LGAKSFQRIAATLLWAAKTERFDFSREDRVDAAKFNLIQWQSLMGENVPYLMVRDGQEPQSTAREWRESRIASFTRHQATEQTDAGGKYD